MDWDFNMSANNLTIILIAMVVCALSACAEIPQSSQSSQSSDDVYVSKYDSMIENNHMSYEDFIQYLASQSEQK